MIYCPYVVEKFKEFFNNKRRGDENRIFQIFLLFFANIPHRLQAILTFLKASKFFQIISFYLEKILLWN